MSVSVSNREDPAEALGLEVDVEGAVGGAVAEVEEYLQASDVFVLPSENEAFGASLVEAMSCGLSVVATPVGAMKEIVEDGRSGLLVPPGDFSGLFAALDRLLRNDDMSRRMGRVAAEAARDRYSAQVVLKRVTSLLQKVSARGTPNK